MSRQKILQDFREFRAMAGAYRTFDRDFNINRVCRCARARQSLIAALDLCADGVTERIIKVDGN